MSKRKLKIVREAKIVDIDNGDLIAYSEEKPDGRHKLVVWSRERRVFVVKKTVNHFSEAEIELCKLCKLFGS